MNESEFGNDFITLTDEEGNEIELEHVDTLEYEGEMYMAFVPAYDGPEELVDDSAELIILKTEEVDGEEMLVTLDDDDLLDKLFEMFVKRLEEEVADEENGDFSDEE
ncbi:MAG: DUF1292 domain-containing protein [Clostridiales bacterium]|nr:DUF1292 domain-containing protein [Clostridiales bacterium]